MNRQNALFEKLSALFEWLLAYNKSKIKAYREIAVTKVVGVRIKCFRILAFHAERGL